MGQSTIKIQRPVQSAPYLFPLLLINMSSILDILTFSHAAGSNNPKVITQENLYLANNLVFNVVQTDPDDTDALQEEQQMWVTK